MLRIIARILRDHARGVDVVARYGDEAEAPEDLLGIADARLYTARHAGRSRLCG